MQETQQDSHASPSDPGPGAARSSNAEECIARALLPGEHVAVLGQCLRMAEPQVFEEATIALTEERLLIAAATPPLGFEMKEAHSLAACSVVNGKERPDGTRLLIMKHDTGKLYLYFDALRSREADALVASIGHTPPRTGAAAAPALLAEPDAAPQTGPVDYGDTFALTQFLHDLTEANINGETDDD